MYVTNKVDSTIRYKKAIEYISKFQFHGFRLGLERMEAITRAMGMPHLKYPAIHVAGTNGKGSVCAFLESILTEAGYKVGLYTSPHLYCLEERFRINRRPISRDELSDLIGEIRGLVEGGYELSYFEYTTAIAMAWFARKGVDVAIFETGLGGRLDATNIVHPEICVITNIALEHQAFLGDTLEKIAWEKAGIIKPCTPLVCGVKENEAFTVIEKRAKALKAPIYRLQHDFHYSPLGINKMDFSFSGRDKFRELELGLRGQHQLENGSLALAAIEVLRGLKCLMPSNGAISRGLRHVIWPCRGEVVERAKRLILLDGAHNMAGVLALRGLMEQDRRLSQARPKVLLWAVSDEGGDKDFLGLLEAISKGFDTIVITEPPGPRRPIKIEMWKEKMGVDDALFEREWERALERAFSHLSDGGVLVVSGSLYLVGAVRSLL